MRIALPRLRNTGPAPRPTGRRDELLGIVHALADPWSPDLVVFPELAVCGYPGVFDRADDEALMQAAEPLSGPTVAAFAEAAATMSTAIAYGMCELDPTDGRRYSTVIWADPSGTSTGYRKIHLTPAERTLFAPGSRAVVVPTTLGPAGLSSCYDRMFPQIYQRQREQGARLSVVASAWSSYDGPLGGDLWADHARLLDRTRAVETGMVVVSTNYEGPKLPGGSDRFCGGQRVVDGLGRELTPVAADETALVWELDLDRALAEVELLNEGDFFGRDRRPVD